MHTVSWITSDGQLERGRTQLLNTSVTTDHPVRAGSLPPPGRRPPFERGRGGGGDDKPDRLQIYAARLALWAAVLPIALIIANAITRARRW